MSSGADFCTEVAGGRLTSLERPFLRAGFTVTFPLPGVVQICAAPELVTGKTEPAALRGRLLLSAGIHGDETAPVEMLTKLLSVLKKHPHQLAVDLLVVVGNLCAIAQKKRYIDVDLNRLFLPECSRSADADASGNTCPQFPEQLRAKQLMQIVQLFFSGNGAKWHLDLHSAIRDSVYPAFAIVPGQRDAVWLDWLGSAGIAAVILNTLPSASFSSYTASYCGALSCTAELGRVSAMGHNKLSRFSVTFTCIASLLRCGALKPGITEGAMPVLFRVKHEFIKKTAAFAFSFDDSTCNFTQFAPGTLIATDINTIYRVSSVTEYVLFPNAGVRVGLRAGLMVVAESQDRAVS